MFSADQDIKSFYASVTPANTVDHDPSGLSYPPRKIWWKCFKENSNYRVLLFPYSIEKNSPILFYRSDLKSSEWNVEHLYAAIVPNNTESVMFCKVDLSEETVVFRYDPTIYLLNFHEQQKIVDFLSPPIAIRDIVTVVLLFMIMLLFILLA
jgi:hypothetical protein